ncbi:hypothetical protein QJS04_geneDACA008845 [Acorus gramineus]|uniref:TmcB/TmcC TPR repeats domain-containing protein n=1 Tax=Acorus gramineus TaxID=55184 RepID=A0AAV9AE63_ACOGR|nr:hypothetical protein QJS04_geneDACA008845 [Acorus gramineus]
MKAVLTRTSSGPVQSSLVLGSARSSLPSDQDQGVSEVAFSRRSLTRSRSLQFEARMREDQTDLIRSDRIRRVGSGCSFPERISEEEADGGGSGKGRRIGGGRGSGGDGSDEKGIGAYYEEMLKADPSNPLLLRNYGKFLHEVEKDLVRAEEYYGRAILASPGDGELLSLYGKLLWDTERDEERANSYFDRAVEASPDDCFVLGSYANFLWDAEDEEEEEHVGENRTAVVKAY